MSSALTSLPQQAAAATLGLRTSDLVVLLPLLILGLGAVLVLLLDVFLPKGPARRATLGAGTLLILAGAFLASLYQYSPAWIEPRAAQMAGTPLGATWGLDPYYVIATMILIGITLLTFLIAAPWLGEDEQRSEGEFWTLLLLFPFGGTLMVAGRDLMVVFIGLEILSISLYVLTALRRRHTEAVEAGMKYFLLGAFAAGFFLYGAALIYAGNGDLVLPRLGPVSRPGMPVPTGLAALGGGLLFVALFFKASVFPFHMWTPDVYQGAGTPVTALMSTGTKAAAFFVLVAIAPWLPREILPLLPWVALATMLVGNVGALAQTDLKRLIAYSGIAHAGYLLVGYTALARGTGPVDAGISIRAIIFYLATYAFTNLGALGVVAYLERADGRPATLDGIRAAGRKHPLAAACLTLCALSLGGIPPTAGFWGKYQVFAAAVNCGEIWLAVVGILFSAIALYYYLRIVVALWFTEEVEGAELAFGRGNPLAFLGMTVPALAVLAFGLMPGVLLKALVLVKL
jgi:NADH-quinone oxidoreductase subunit N